MFWSTEPPVSYLTARLSHEIGNVPKIIGTCIVFHTVTKTLGDCEQKHQMKKKKTMIMKNLLFTAQDQKLNETWQL